MLSYSYVIAEYETKSITLSYTILFDIYPDISLVKLLSSDEDGFKAELRQNRKY